MIIDDDYWLLIIDYYWWLMIIDYYWLLLLWWLLKKIVITNFSSSINEVIRSVLNFFFYDKILQVQKSTKKH